MKKNPDYPKWKLFLDLGTRNLELDENESAINVLSKSISIKQDNYLSFYYRAIAQHRMKNYLLAIEDLKKSLELKKDFYSYIQIGISYNNTYQYNCALKNYNFAYKLFCKNSKIKNSNQLFFHRGITLYELKKYQHSIYDFNKAIKLGFDGFDVFQNRGFGYLRLKKFDNALLDFKESIKRNPDNINLLKCYEQLGLINIKLNNFNEVIKYAKEGLLLSFKHYWDKKKKLTNAELEHINKAWLLFLGFANIKLNNYEKAEYWLDKVNFLYINNLDIRPCEALCRAFTLSKLGKYDEALYYFRWFLNFKKYGNLFLPEIEELIDELPVEMKTIIRIKFQYKFNN